MTRAICGQRCISFGVPFRLSADSGSLLAAMRQCAPFGTEFCDRTSGEAQLFTQSFTVLGAEGNAGYRLLVANELIAENTDQRHVLDRLASELMVHVANYAPGRVFLHAGVVAWGGQALVLPGTSFAGKTTLVAELVRAGAVYYSDEYAVLDAEGRVHPYPRELQMRLPGETKQRAVSVEEIYGVVGADALPVALVVFAEYSEAGSWDPEPLSAGTAVLEMLRHSIPVQRAPARVMATLAKMMETATALRSMRGEANETARALLAAMDACRSGV